MSNCRVCVSGKAVYIWRKAVVSSHDNKEAFIIHLFRKLDQWDPIKDTTTMCLTSSLWQRTYPQLGPRWMEIRYHLLDVVIFVWRCLLMMILFFFFHSPFSCWWGFSKAIMRSGWEYICTSRHMKHLLSVGENESNQWSARFLCHHDFAQQMASCLKPSGALTPEASLMGPYVVSWGATKKYHKFLFHHRINIWSSPV